jgi:3-oxoacyl-[acyl-carrier protein] reductase
MRKTVFITGASGGIGLAVAKRFAQNGDALFLHFFSNREPLDRLQKEFPDVPMQFAQADLTQISEQDRLAEEAWNWRGGIQSVIQAAGVDILTGERKKWTFEQKLAALWNVDVQASMLIARNAAQKISIAGQNGSILLIGWDAVDWGMAGDSAQLFAAAKGAVTAFARSLAQGVGPNVRVNVLAPGWIQTEWGKQAPAAWQKHAKKDSLLDRWGTPQEVADAAFFLCSENAAFLNGVVLPVDGGKRF